MRIDGKPISNGVLAEIVDELSAVVEALRGEDIHPTEFEIGTALAFSYFAREKVDIAVIEVGLGGRIDPTNVIMPLVSGIASIGLDHMKALGYTKASIAREKAGIAKPGVPLVLSGQADAETLDMIQACCEAVGAPFSLAGHYDKALGLSGAYQKNNAGLAKEMLVHVQKRGFAISEQAIEEGFSRARWPGRLEWAPFTPPLLLDGSHNPQGAKALKEYMRSLPKLHTVLLFGVLQDKDFAGIIDQCAQFADDVVAVSPDENRGISPCEIASLFSVHGIRAVCCGTVSEGLQKAADIAEAHGGRIVAAGSLYLIGKVRTLARVPECELLDS